MLLSKSFVACSQQSMRNKLRLMGNSAMPEWNVSLDSFSCAVVRLATDFTPNWLLRSVLLLLRYVLALLLLRDHRFSIVPLAGVGPARAKSDASSFDDIGSASAAAAAVEVISFDDGSGPDRLHREAEPVNEDVVVYLHGGGFNICDSADLLIAESLLPRLQERLNAVPHTKMRPRLFTIRYDTVAAPVGSFPWDPPAESALEQVHQQVFQSFKEIETSGRRVIAVAGDSAGGNLALGLLFALQQSRPREELPALVLVSPWVDLFTSPPTPAAVARDMLSPSWLKRCRESYLGTVAPDAAALDVPHQLAEQLAHRVVSLGIRVVAFDMDQCLVARHSRGRLRRTRQAVAAFARSTSRDFVAVARALHRRGILLAVATHSDAYEYGVLRPRSRYILGEPLVRAVLSMAVPELADQFHVVAFNPACRGIQDPEIWYKKKHIHDIARHYGVGRSEVLLFDDDEHNVRNTGDNFVAVKTDPVVGFRTAPALSALLKQVGTLGMSARLRLGQTIGTSSEPGPEPVLSHGTVSVPSMLPMSALACPASATDDMLAQLPPTLVIVGGAELFYESIAQFVERARRVQGAVPSESHSESHSDGRASSAGSQTPNVVQSPTSFESLDYEPQFTSHSMELLVGEGEVHCYPMLWRSVLQRVLVSVGLLEQYLCLRQWMRCMLAAPVADAYGDNGGGGDSGVSRHTPAEERCAYAIDSMALFLAEHAARRAASGHMESHNGIEDVAPSVIEPEETGVMVPPLGLRSDNDDETTSLLSIESCVDCVEIGAQGGGLGLEGGDASLLRSGGLLWVWNDDESDGSFACDNEGEDDGEGRDMGRGYDHYKKVQ